MQNYETFEENKEIIKNTFLFLVSF